MATSAQTLATILENLSVKYKFDKDDAIGHLATLELLPKKLLPKAQKSVTGFASKKAEEVAAEHGIVPDGPGSGKDGKWTLKDVQSKMATPTATKLLVSPNALSLANEHHLDLVGRKGTGKDGRILVKDVEGWLPAEGDDKEELDISPRALQEATDNGISKTDLATIHGTGKNGRLLLTDVKKYISESAESESESDED
jgi:pyruvate/2-oxoglutarate dehydrogenase complex dihydrolipoamide acyltransferase (E2) component